MNRWEHILRGKLPKEKRPKVTPSEEEPENWEYGPRELDEAVDYIFAQLPEEELKELRGLEETDLFQLHHGFGTAIRNEFGLWKGNKELLFSCGTNCPDDASMVIIKALWIKTQEEL